MLRHVAFPYADDSFCAWPPGLSASEISYCNDIGKTLFPFNCDEAGTSSDRESAPWHHTTSPHPHPRTVSHVYSICNNASFPGIDGLFFGADTCVTSGGIFRNREPFAAGRLGEYPSRFRSSAVYGISMKNSMLSTDC